MASPPPAPPEAVGTVLSHHDISAFPARGGSAVLRQRRIPRPESVELKIDCSFVPALVYHRPPRDDLVKLGVCGCEGGNVLLSITSAGVFSGCSFIVNDDGESILDLRGRWHSSSHLNRFRQLVIDAAEPCRSCAHLSVCRCGCRATALYHTADFLAPDPECPIVLDFARKDSSGGGAGPAATSFRPGAPAAGAAVNHRQS